MPTTTTAGAAWTERPFRLMAFAFDSPYLLLNDNNNKNTTLVHDLCIDRHGLSATSSTNGVWWEETILDITGVDGTNTANLIFICTLTNASSWFVSSVGNFQKR